jgi:hypothetical protein
MTARTVCTLCGGRWATTAGQFRRDDLCATCYDAWLDGRTGCRFEGVRYRESIVKIAYHTAPERVNRKMWQLARRTDDFRAYRSGLRDRLESQRQAQSSPARGETP